MGKIADLAITDKPREKAERFGIESLKDDELLALIINSGTVGHSSLDIARDLLSECHYLSEVFSKPKQYFASFKGLKSVIALRLLAVSEISKRMNEKQRLIYEEKAEITSESLFQRYVISLAGISQEVMAIVILNKNKQIVFESVLYRGDHSGIRVNYRDIMRLLLLHNGYYFYLIHNHPNGSLEPSEADIKFTEKVKEKSANINAQLVDHLIINKDGYYSFLHQRLLTSEEK